MLLSVPCEQLVLGLIQLRLSHFQHPSNMYDVAWYNENQSSRNQYAQITCTAEQSECWRRLDSGRSRPWRLAEQLPLLYEEPFESRVTNRKTVGGPQWMQRQILGANRDPIMVGANRPRNRCGSQKRGGFDGWQLRSVLLCEQDLDRVCSAYV